MRVEDVNMVKVAAALLVIVGMLFGYVTAFVGWILLLLCCPPVTFTFRDLKE